VTIIAAVARGGHVVMGSDSAANYSGSIVYKAEGKIEHVPTNARLIP